MLRADIAALVGGPVALASRDLDALVALVPARQVRQLVAIADIQARLHSSGVWWAIKAALSSAMTSPEIRGAAQAVVDVAGARYDNVDFSIPLVAQMFGALVDGGIMPQAILDELIAMSWRSVPYSASELADLLYNADGSDK